MALIFSMLLGSMPVVHAESSPLRLEVQLSADGETVTVFLKATEELTLSNYDAQLGFDSNVFTIIGIYNGQPAKLPIFQCNTASGSNAGKLSAASAGSNVAIGADETLATYTLSVAKEASSEKFTFILTILDAANEDGNPLPWKGVMPSTDLEWEEKRTELLEVRLSEQSLTLDLSCWEPDSRLCCAAYTSAGQMCEIRFLSLEGNGRQELEFDLNSNPVGFVRVFLLNDQFCPLCESCTAIDTAP